MILGIPKNVHLRRQLEKNNVYANFVFADIILAPFCIGIGSSSSFHNHPFKH